MIPAIGALLVAEYLLKGTCTENPCSVIFPNPNGKPVTSVADVAFDHTLPLAVLQTMRTMTPTKRLLCLIRIFKHQADDVFQFGISPNATAEGFFGRLKQEFFHKRSFKGVSMGEFIDMLDDYMVWYRDKRIKTEYDTSIMDCRRELGLVA